jgi:hypothetical protein
MKDVPQQMEARCKGGRWKASTAATGNALLKSLKLQASSRVRRYSHGDLLANPKSVFLRIPMGQCKTLSFDENPIICIALLYANL